MLVYHLSFVSSELDKLLLYTTCIFWKVWDIIVCQSHTNSQEKNIAHKIRIWEAYDEATGYRDQTDVWRVLILRGLTI